MSGWSLPRIVRQHVVGLRSKVESGTISADEAGRQLADHLKERWPSIVDALLVRWCSARFHRSIPLPEGWIQQSLWPASLWLRPLSESIAYSKNSIAMTRRWGKRDRAREAELKTLIAAADGDLTMTLKQAFQLAHPSEETATG